MEEKTSVYIHLKAGVIGNSLAEKTHKNSS